MNILTRIRQGESGILASGVHPRVFQSILDFDALSGKKEPSILAIITSNRKALKLFFGNKEVLIPCFSSMDALPGGIRKKVSWLLNVQSGRRAYDSTHAFFQAFPEALGAHIFAENMPEIQAQKLVREYGSTKCIAGPSGVGLLVPAVLKLGAIGGIDAMQIARAHLTDPGSVAVVSTSGGMTNELMRAVTEAGHGISFSLCIGGERFPSTSLSEVFLLAENDDATRAVVYFGELGGSDEYELAELIRAKRVTKPVVAYIAGIIDESFEDHVQFGHAKALVRSNDESARAKRDALTGVGVIAPETFGAFLDALEKLPGEPLRATVLETDHYMNRTPSILSTREIVDLDEVPVFVKDGALVKGVEYGFARATTRALLGKEVSDVTAAFIENVLELLIDHGGNVSGAVNTMISARAGKDLVSSLASGLLTIGPRFGGAVNDAAKQWIDGVSSSADAKTYVEEKTKGGALLAGIGHRKYRVGIPDPRVEALSQFVSLLKAHSHYDFARSIEGVTTAKNGNLILNVDGVMAALLLDILAEKEGYDARALSELAEAEFFNALFVIPRSIGFIAHFLEQKQNDEGLFRLPDELLFVRKNKKQE